MYKEDRNCRPKAVVTTSLALDLSHIAELVAAAAPDKNRSYDSCTVHYGARHQRCGYCPLCLVENWLFHNR